MVQPRQTASVEVIVCEKCGCTWFAEASVNRFSGASESLYMTPARVHYDADFPVLICIKCHNIVIGQKETYGIAPGSANWDLFQEMITAKSADQTEVDQANRGKTKIISTYNITNGVTTRR